MPRVLGCSPACLDSRRAGWLSVGLLRIKFNWMQHKCEFMLWSFGLYHQSETWLSSTAASVQICSVQHAGHQLLFLGRWSITFRFPHSMWSSPTFLGSGVKDFFSDGAGNSCLPGTSKPALRKASPVPVGAVHKLKLSNPPVPGYVINDIELVCS